MPDGTWNFDAKGALNALGKIGESMGMFRQVPKQEGEARKSVEEFLQSLPDDGREF